MIVLSYYFFHLWISMTTCIILQAEEKIKQLEEEISSLKSQKQSKNIKDYFGKK